MVRSERHLWVRFVLCKDGGLRRVLCRSGRRQGSSGERQRGFEELCGGEDPEVPGRLPTLERCAAMWAKCGGAASAGSCL
ncbi:hypothetical protein RchiOBHm_Chr2g0114601 [Rosa chinensis]|uniref:Uncharacterized protein n=1 Tax=Rosa chinensis TaxID=74649 RepID=A0A2P6RQW5_ROSCH|nr:hypothetical protein RchiOBHm_Chr2g0114601 [Rosa chinensis]